MRRVFWCAALAVLVAVGCKEEKKGGSSSSGAAGASDSGKVERPKSPPTASRLWTQGEVEAWIREDFGLTEMALTPGDAGSFSGTGKDEAGVKYTLRVTQRPGLIVLDHERPAPTAPGKMMTGQVRFWK
jgi:hypothetical protein